MCPIPAPMSARDVQKFCADFRLPDLSPLITESLPTQERHAVMWQVMQRRLSVRKQGEFLRQFCEKSGVPALCSFVVFLRGDMNADLCNNAMDVIKKMDGVEPLIGGSMKDFCVAQEIKGFATLADKFGFESIVFSIDQLFPVVDERMHYALDVLKFEANPTRFSDDLDGLIKKREAAFSDEMAELKANLLELQLEKEGLEKELGPESPVLGSKRKAED